MFPRSDKVGYVKFRPPRRADESILPHHTGVSSAWPMQGLSLSTTAARVSHGRLLEALVRALGASRSSDGSAWLLLPAAVVGSSPQVLMDERMRRRFGRIAGAVQPGLQGRAHAAEAVGADPQRNAAGVQPMRTARRGNPRGRGQTPRSRAGSPRRPPGRSAGRSGRHPLNLAQLGRTRPAAGRQGRPHALNTAERHHRPVSPRRNGYSTR
jgi:hypothetical protein